MQKPLQVIVCGGWRYDDDGHSGNRVLVDTVDVFDPASGGWHVETRVPTPRYHAGVVLVGGRLYVVGGCLGDSLFDRATGKFMGYLSYQSWFKN